MESQEPNFAATATGVPSAGVVTVGKAEDSSRESIDLKKIAAIVWDIRRDTDLAAIVGELSCFCPPPESDSTKPWDSTAAERAGKVMNFESLMIMFFSEAKKKLLQNPKLPARINVQMGFIIKTESPYIFCVMFGLAEDSTEGSIEKLDVEKAYAALAECASDAEEEIEDRMIDLFLSVKKTIERAKAVAFEETVAAAAPEGKIPKKFHDLIKTIVPKLCYKNSFARAYYAFTLFQTIICKQTMLPIDDGEEWSKPPQKRLKI